MACMEEAVPFCLGSRGWEGLRAARNVCVWRGSLRTSSFLSFPFLLLSSLLYLFSSVFSFSSFFPPFVSSSFFQILRLRVTEIEERGEIRQHHCTICEAFPVRCSHVVASD